MIHRWQLFTALSLLLFFLLGALWLTGSRRRGREDGSLLAVRRQLVAGLQLTDFAIWTEARYTRHPSQADFFTPFQDFPGALEHFPAGSLLAPPVSHPLTRLRVAKAKRP
ncbi:hypothetical protein C2E25_06680 [Geothermobacter hydrogeniphilus]|uniref:Uncharacterized protein n=1 Tax=Geothermobacter hydrogeniphilus TaxID=1969733 RepID=A0A2K2HBB6_9BACT|nr:hypothetical protein [Geothermobacter hydrogeniphilus]PNU20557.1 hypothetical protein C2E25_06680 [Geothermobacter hydrogeniphilus]